MRNYTVAFLGVVPIEKGQAILPVLLVRYHFKKRLPVGFEPCSIHF